MMKKIIPLILLGAFIGSAGAGDDVYVLEEALELGAKHVRFSLAGAGNITVRSCRECSPMTLPLTHRTEYLVNGEHVARDRFAELSRLGGAVYMFYSTQTGYVTKMRLNTPSNKRNRPQR